MRFIATLTALGLTVASSLAPAAAAEITIVSAGITNVGAISACPAKVMFVAVVGPVKLPAGVEAFATWQRADGSKATKPLPVSTANQTVSYEIPVPSEKLAGWAQFEITYTNLPAKTDLVPSYSAKLPFTLTCPVAGTLAATGPAGLLDAKVLKP